ncbi:hypothetical protein M2282_000674 [Variovorax boronicumulans]|nr:hypothetical protein [Variovorax boronicumulans]
MSINSLQLVDQRIGQIAEELSRCNRACSGVRSSEGCPPRGLILQHEDVLDTARGVIVVGQNPGFAARWEQKLYGQHGAGYVQQRMAWQSGVKNVPYFTMLKRLLDILNVRGPVLWTDVAKCEGRSPPEETRMICSQKFMSREFAAAPQEWPVIAAGRDAYAASGYMAALRTVIGFYHPTGRNGQQFRLQLSRLENDQVFREEMNTALHSQGARKWVGKQLAVDLAR